MSTSTIPPLPCTSVARVSTTRPARYGHQLASHMGRTLTAQWDEEAQAGRLIFDRDGTVSGVLELACESGALVMTLRSTPGNLGRLEQVAGIHLARFGHKDQLAVSWVREDGAAGSSQGPLSAEDMARMRREHQQRQARHSRGHATEMSSGDDTVEAGHETHVKGDHDPLQ